MKAFGGGDLLSDDSPAGKAVTVNQCIHYALTRPGVASVLSGVHSREQLEASLAYEYASEEEKDYAEVFAAFPKSAGRDIVCTVGTVRPARRKLTLHW